MTHANTDQHTPWFAKAGAGGSIIPISRFVGPHIFALKRGGYGCLFSLLLWKVDLPDWEMWRATIRSRKRDCKEEQHVHVPL
jgi:hypothetical protein